MQISFGPVKKYAETARQFCVGIGEKLDIGYVLEGGMSVVHSNELVYFHQPMSKELQLCLGCEKWVDHTQASLCEACANEPDMG